MTKHHRAVGSGRASLYDGITTKIISKLEAGRLPWVRRVWKCRAFGWQRSALAKCADLFAVQVQRNSRVERDHLGHDRSQAGRVRSFSR